MHRFTWAAAVTAAMTATAAGQAPAPDAGRVDQLLDAWQKKMASVQTMTANCEVVEVDKKTGRKAGWAGWALFQKPNLAHVLIHRDGDRKKKYRRWISTGRELWTYDSRQREVGVFKLPKGDRQQNEEAALSFLFGMTAEQAKKRFRFQIAKETDAYTYVWVFPESNNDKKNFVVARVAFYTAQMGPLAMLPSQIWFRHHEKFETTWTFTNTRSNVRVDPRYFAPKPKPDGWVKQEHPLKQPAPKRRLPVGAGGRR